MYRNILQGKKIAITALDLEQKEHRGLAVLSKSLISLLNKYGAEVYLITQISPSRLNKKKLKRSLSDEIFIADIFHDLEKGFSYREMFNKNKVYRFRFILNLIFETLKLYLKNFNLKNKFLLISQNHKDINIFSQRLAYLNEVRGFIFVKEIFNLCRLRSMRLIFKTPTLKISKKDIDLIITTCPLSLVNHDKRSAKIIQIIPDIIPIQVSSHPENPVVFYNRLLDAHLSKTFYISQATQSSAKKILGIENKKIYTNEILYPLPSINLDLISNAMSLPSIREINNPFILFNSSIVERKRVELSINFFKNSELPKRGLKLLIAGKIHNSNYSDYIKKMCEKNKQIVLMDYVSEVEKMWLFLNASLLISTSSSEGFGIPVLDAATLNLPVLASNIPSHLEIKNLVNSKKITLLDIKHEKAWINYLSKLEIFDIENEKSKFLRIKHYKKSLKSLEFATLGKIQKLISN